MKLRELQKFTHPLQMVKVLFRDPGHSLQTSVVFEGFFKRLEDNIILDRNVAVQKAYCSVLYIEIF